VLQTVTESQQLTGIVSAAAKACEARRLILSQQQRLLVAERRAGDFNP
jgi:hypothetical protein